jgi:hypothetical protein
MPWVSKTLQSEVTGSQEKSCTACYPLSDHRKSLQGILQGRLTLCQIISLISGMIRAGISQDQWFSDMALNVATFSAEGERGQKSFEGHKPKT